MALALNANNPSKRMFLLHVDVLGEDEEDYPTAPVWERRKLFGKQ